MSRKYSEHDISYFKNDTDKIRAKPSMYIGPTDSDGIFSLVREVFDNSLDEHRAGRNSSISIFYDGEFITIADSGVGIPVKPHPKAKISTLTHVLTSLQSSGKMSTANNSAYSGAIGVHGVGIKATNALSDNFKCWTYRKDAGGWHYTEFEKGQEKKKVGKSAPPKLPDGSKQKIGTVISFKPDMTIMSGKLVWSNVVSWASLSSYLNPGLLIKLWLNGKSKEYKQDGGISSLIKKKLVELETNTVGEPIIAVTQDFDMAFAFTDLQDTITDWYTNTVYNASGGFHADSFTRALVDSLKPYQGKNTFKPNDLRAGLVGILNIRINAPKFSSQTKEKLVDERAKTPLYEALTKVLDAWWKKHKGQAKDICIRAAEYSKAVIDFRNNTKAMRALKVKDKVLLPGKLTRAMNCHVSERELYLLEGDSASGSARSARNKDFQEVLALKGKIVNALRKTQATVLASVEVISILQAIGFDPNKSDPLKHLRVGRIILLCDADHDGGHIESLVLTLLHEYVPQLFTMKMIYAVAAAEFTATYKGKRIFAHSLKELKNKTDGETVPKDTLHLKGWGELDAEPLKELAFNKSTRRMYRILPPVDKKDTRIFRLIMAEDPSYRKTLLGV